MADHDVVNDRGEASLMVRTGEQRVVLIAQLKLFKGRQLYITNLSLFDGGVNSKLSVVEVPHPGLPLRP